MKSKNFLTAVLAGLILPCWLGAAIALGLNGADEKAIHNVVQSQLDAFAEDDAPGAFALATPDTRAQFGDPENFLDTVRQHFNPIYRHRVAHFATPEMLHGVTIQIVRLVDANSHVWFAIYRMKRDPDGTWKIDDCDLLETASVSV